MNNIGYSATPFLENPRITLVIKFILALLIVILSSCNIESRPYATSFDKAGLQELLQSNRKLSIISFTSDALLYTPSGEELATNPFINQDTRKREATDITSRLTSVHFEKTLDGLSEKFVVVGSLTHDEVKNSNTQTQQIVEAITESDADFGLVVKDQFGWSWSPGRTGVDSYYFTTCAIIYDRKGQSTWNFCNKGALIPMPDTGSLLSGIVGVTPPIESIIGDFDIYFTNYPKFILLLIDEDAEGKDHGATFEYYFPEMNRLGRPFIINIGDERYLPNFP